jgi:hypothetical protein
VKVWEGGTLVTMLVKYFAPKVTVKRAEQIFRLFIILARLSQGGKINGTQFHSYFWSKIFDQHGY